MDINTMAITGRVFNVGLHPMLGNKNTNVAEGILMVTTGKKDGVDTTDEFGIRAYGKKADFVAGLKNGTLVAIQGMIREDIRVNARQPDTVRSKVYINIDRIKVMEVPK